MTTRRIAAFIHLSRLPFGAVLLTATFAAGLATGQSLPGVAAGQAPLACSVSPVLDTSLPYLTIQHGVIVPGR